MTDQLSETPTQAFWPHSPRPSSEAALLREAARTLAEIADVARRGDYQQARELCAAAVFGLQPLIAARPELLQATLRALLIARGFMLLSRFIMAVSGLRVSVVLLPPTAKPVASPQPREAGGQTVYEMHPRWLDRLTSDDAFLRDWCAILMARPDRATALAGPASVARDLAPV